MRRLAVHHRGMILLLAIFVSMCAAPARAEELTVFAASSLMDALKEIGAAYERESRDKVVFSFGASNLLARQIEQGAPADVFISADEAKMDALEQKTLLAPGTRRGLLSNSLVLVIATFHVTPPASFRDLAGPQIRRLALAEPATVPAGIYARQFLERAGVWAQVKDKIIPTENVRAALAAVESGNADAAIVYKTDALISKKVKIAAEATATDAPEILYPLAILRATPRRAAAEKLAQFLAGAEANRIFAKFGFTRPE